MTPGQIATRRCKRFLGNSRKRLIAGVSVKFILYKSLIIENVCTVIMCNIKSLTCSFIFSTRFAISAYFLVHVENVFFDL